MPNRTRSGTVAIFFVGLAWAGIPAPAAESLAARDAASRDSIQRDWMLQDSMRVALDPALEQQKDEWRKRT